MKVVTCLMENNDQNYPSVDPFQAGLRGRCPRCGEGDLLKGFLTLKGSCSSCRLDYSFAEQADGPAVFIMLIVGFVVVGLALWLEVNYSPAVWVHIVILFPIAIAMSLYLQRVLKGVMTCLQYKHQAKQGHLDRS